MAVLLLETVAAVSTSTWGAGAFQSLVLDPTTGGTASTWGFRADLSDNLPIEIAFDLYGQYLLYPPVTG